MEQILVDETEEPGASEERESGSHRSHDAAPKHLTPAEVDEQWKEVKAMLTEEEQVRHLMMTRSDLYSILTYIPY